MLKWCNKNLPTYQYIMTTPQNQIKNTVSKKSTKSTSFSIIIVIVDHYYLFEIKSVLNV